MNPAGDIAQQQANLDNAWSDYQPAVDEYGTARAEPGRHAFPGWSLGTRKTMSGTARAT
jgi:hypothetical protein